MLQPLLHDPARLFQAMFLSAVIHKAFVEVNEHLVTPESLAQFIACDHSSGVFQQRSEHLEGLVAETNPVAALAENAGVQIDFETVEVNDL